jgi:hypothetical protein
VVPKNMLVWDKGSGLGSNYANAHELLMFAWLVPLRQNMTQKITGGRTVNDANIWRVSRVGAAGTKGGRVHNAQKPVELMERAIHNSSESGGRILDLFGGAGSTMVAAERSRRRALTMEIDPRWCDVAVRRWQDLTGGRAKLDGEGRSFAEVEASRLEAGNGAGLEDRKPGRRRGARRSAPANG